jgi:hypothetical protein
MRYEDQLEKTLQRVVELAQREGKLTGFCIGNTRKVDSTGLYFSPIRNTAKLVAGSVIVCKVSEAANIARMIDGMVQYILVDTEKKISPEMYEAGDVGNVERAVREVVRCSTILTYKGNDITVDSIDCLLAQLVADAPRGIGGKKVAIIGAGNLGSKLALKLVERGAHVVITRRDREKLETIVRALNYIKPEETISQVTGTTDNEEAACNADILIGMTNGIPVITPSIIEHLSSGALVMDGGKGCLFPDAIRRAEELGLIVLRVDIRAGFEGQIAMLLEMERILKQTVGRREINGVNIVSGGLLARRGEIVVDNVYKPTAVYGVADGTGDFIRSLSAEQIRQVEVIQRCIHDSRHRPHT